MKYTYITDEASQDPKEFIRLAAQFNLDSVELRTVNGKRVCEMEDRELQELKGALDYANLTVCCLDTFVFKQNVECNLETEFDKLKKAIDIALYIGAPIIRIFTFLRTENRDLYEGKITEVLLRAGEIIEKSGVKLAIENCRKTNHSSGAELELLFRNLSNEVFTVLWDPANSLMSGVDLNPEKNGYPLIAQKISHIHIKDPYIFTNGDRKYVTLGKGQLNIIEHFRQLMKDKYDKYISLETHWRSNRDMSLAEFDIPGGEGFSSSGYSATENDLHTLTKFINTATSIYDI